MRRLCLLFCLPLLSGASKAQACSPEPNPGPGAETVRVTAIRDFGTLVLADGRELRLAGVAVPGERWRGRPSVPVIRRLAERARARLEALAAGREILPAHESPQDRYGRRRAQAFVPDRNNAPLWLQGELVSAGLARVDSDADTRACARPLLRLEAQARRQRLGLWRLRLYAVRDAARPGRHTGSWQIVEGRVRSIARVRGRVFLNFGEDWRKDFTISVNAKAARRWAKGFWDGKEGRMVRVRGWMEDYNGPLIEATHPEQLEWLEDGPGGTDVRQAGPPEAAPARPAEGVNPAAPPPPGRDGG